MAIMVCNFCNFCNQSSGNLIDGRRQLISSRPISSTVTVSKSTVGKVIGVVESG